MLVAGGGKYTLYEASRLRSGCMGVLCRLCLPFPQVPRSHLVPDTQGGLKCQYFKSLHQECH